MKNKLRIEIGVVALFIFAGLLLWWIVRSEPITNPFVLENASATSSPAAEANPKATGAVSKVNRSTQTVNTIVANLSGITRFKALYKSTGVSASVSSSGRYTIFVPTNGAFAQLPASIIAEMTTPEKRRLMEYHIVSGRSIDVDAEVAGTITAVSGDALNFNYGADKIPMVNSAIVITEYVGKNGNVYLIDNVLLPPMKAPGSI